MEKNSNFKKYIIFLFFILLSYNVSAQKLYDLSEISKEKIAIDSRLVIGHENELRLILLLGIEISLYNIERSNTIVTGAGTGNWNQYHYLTVSPDFSVSVKQKEKMRLEYNPSHVAAVSTGDLKGYVRYHDFDVLQECSDIAAMIKILDVINIIENAQQSYDLSRISDEKIIIDSRFVIGHENELKNILIQAIDLTLDNIININAIIDTVDNRYQYHYLTVSPDFSVSTMKKVKIISDTSLSSSTNVFQRNMGYPDVNIIKECNDISETIVILGALNNIKIRKVFNSD